MVFLGWLVMEWWVTACSRAVAWEIGLQPLAPLGSLASAAVVQGQLKAIVLVSKTSASSDLSLQAPSL